MDSRLARWVTRHTAPRMSADLTESRMPLAKDRFHGLAVEPTTARIIVTLTKRRTLERGVAGSGSAAEAPRKTPSKHTGTFFSSG
eukprot:571222-Lingulodinium_polyedra.AAC.1